MNRKQLAKKLARLKLELDEAAASERAEIETEIAELERKLAALEDEDDDEDEDEERTERTEDDDDEDDEDDDDEEREPSPAGELERQIERAMRAREARTLERVAKILGRATKPRRRGRLPVEHGERVRESRAGALFSARDVRDLGAERYRSLRPIERKIRNPRVDEALGAWIRAAAVNDRQAIRELGRMIDGEWLDASGAQRQQVRDHLAQYERAAILYGTPDATSGIGGGTGGPLVPLPLAQLIVAARNREAVGRTLFSRFESNAATLRVPTTTVATAAMVAEGAQAADGTPTPGSGLLSKKKAQSRMIASNEMLEDSAFNLVSFFSERGGAALGELEDTQFATSNGTAPNITQAAVTGVTDVAEAVAGTITFAEVNKLFFQVPKAYRRDAVWSADDLILELLSRMVDGNGRPMFTAPVAPPVPVEDSVPGAVGTVLGKPIYGLPYAAGTLMFGNHRLAYGFLDGGGIRVTSSEHTAWATDSVEFKLTERFDGRVLLAAALRKMTGITTVA